MPDPVADIVPSTSRKHRSRHLWVPYALSVGLIVSLVVALATIAVRQELLRYRDRAATATHNIATLLETHISDVLDNIDSDLKTAALFYSLEAARGPVVGARINAFIQQQEAQQDCLESLGIVDKEGNVRYGRGVPVDPPVNLRDRPYFIEARDQPNAGLIISGPVLTRISKKWAVVLARRLNAPDGSFAGVVYANLATTQFEKTFASIALGPQGAATLRTTDFALVHRTPETRNAIGSKEVSAQLAQAIADHPDGGQYLARTAIDGVERSNAYRRLKRYPFYVIVGLATDDYLDGWQSNTILVSVLAVLTALLTGFVGRRMYMARALAESSLQRERELRAAIVESSTDAIIAITLEGIVTSWNAGAEAIFGYTADAMLDQHMRRLLPPGTPEDGGGLRERLSRGEMVKDLELVRQRKDGGLVDVSSSLSPIRDPQGRVIGASIIARDITERKRTEANLRLAASVFTHAHEGIVITDAQVCIVDANSMFEQITGYTREELLGKNPRLSKSGRQSETYYQHMWRQLNEQGHWHGEIWNRRKSGEIYAALLTISTVRGNQGEIQHYVGILSDITPLKEYQRHLEHVAQHDALTDLPNRVLLADQLQQAMAQAQRRSNALAVVYLDLDGFKAVNDTHGHDVGDALLVALSQRMKGVLREGDTLARVGGDEFVALLVDIDNKADCEPVLQRLLQSAAEPVQVGTIEVQVSTSLGAALFPGDAPDAEQLLLHADQAMYTAKQGGRNRFRWFDRDTPAMPVRM